MRGQKAAPRLYLADLSRLPASTVFVVVPPIHPDAAYHAKLQQLSQLVTGRLWAGACLYRDGADEARLALLATEAAALGLPLVASQMVNTCQETTLNDLVRSSSSLP